MKASSRAPLLAACALSALAGCGALFAGSSPEVTADVPSGERTEESYLLRFGDQLDISVWGMDDMNRQVQVHEDGNISFPRLGNIPARGRTLKDVEAALKSGLLLLLQGEQQQQPDTETGSAGRKVISPQEAQSAIYRLQVGDQLQASVWNHADLAREGQILDDGSFSFPLIGDVKAAGRTIREVEQEIRERLDKDYLVNPQVTVVLSKAKYSILGDVKAPGQYEFEGATDLLAAITRAGGIDGTAVDWAEVIREKPDGAVIIRSKPDLIIEGKEPNVTILPRDTVFVKGRKLRTSNQEFEVIVRLFNAKFSVLGDVERPGSYPIETTMDLLTAISQAGGGTRFASSRVEIIRGEGDQKKRIRANMDRIIRGKEPNVAIYPHDTIYVRRRLL